MKRRQPEVHCRARSSESVPGSRCHQRCQSPMSARRSPTKDEDCSGQHGSTTAIAARTDAAAPCVPSRRRAGCAPLGENFIQADLQPAARKLRRRAIIRAQYAGGRPRPSESQDPSPRGSDTSRSSWRCRYRALTQNVPGELLADGPPGVVGQVVGVLRVVADGPHPAAAPEAWPLQGRKSQSSLNVMGKNRKSLDPVRTAMSPAPMNVHCAPPVRR